MFGTKTKTYAVTTSWQSEGRKHACRAEGTLVKKGRRVGNVTLTIDMDRDKRIDELDADVRKAVEKAALEALKVTVGACHPGLVPE